MLLALLALLTAAPAPELPPSADAGVFAPPNPAEAPPPTPQDEVKQLILDQIADWNRGDLEAFCGYYANDAVFLGPSGVRAGRLEVLERYRKRYPDRKAMGTLSMELLDFRSSDQFVSVAANWKLASPGKPATEGHTLVVFVKTGGRWQLVQDASM